MMSDIIDDDEIMIDCDTDDHDDDKSYRTHEVTCTRSLN